MDLGKGRRNTVWARFFDQLGMIRVLQESQKSEKRLGRHGFTRGSAPKNVFAVDFAGC